MFNTILVAIDLNDPNSRDKALGQAVQLARASGGTLHLLTIVPDVGMPLVETFFPANYEQHALEAAKEELDTLAREVLPEGMPHEQHVMLGQITSHIVEAAQKTGADLIVMASHDPDLAQNFLIGGHAGKVVRRSPVSVLVIRG